MSPSFLGGIVCTLTEPALYTYKIRTPGLGDEQFITMQRSPDDFFFSFPFRGPDESPSLSMLDLMRRLIFIGLEILI